MDIRDSDTGLRLLQEVAGAQAMHVLAEEFFCPSPVLPWKKPDTALVQIVKDEKTIAIARCGSGYANVILDPQAIPVDQVNATCAGIGSLLSNVRRTRKQFFFLRDDGTRSRFADSSHYDYVYVHTIAQGE
jgi:hypothetical protein